MNQLRLIGRALALTALDRLGDILAVFVAPKMQSAVASKLPAARVPWITAPLWTEVAVDGAVISGSSNKAGAKYAIPKGLPKEGDRSLAIENEPHLVDGYSGIIESGYGKGTKTLLADEIVAIKVNGEVRFSRMNYHVHDADRAGTHYDLAIQDLEPGTKEWELHIPRGELKGRYAFRQTGKGMIVIPMKDRGIVLPKPNYPLKTVDWLEQQVQPNPGKFVTERKYDGSFATAHLPDQYRWAFRSHREVPGAQTYYDRLPAIEFMRVQSPFLTLRLLDQGPDLADTVLEVELVHSDGVSRVSGILNSHPEKACLVQASRGPVQAYAWDAVKVRGRDVSVLPEGERRQILEDVVREIRLYNPNWYIAERYTGKDPVGFYRKVISDPRGLPYAEGIVVKAVDSVEKKYYKIKFRDYTDLEVIPGGFTEGQGKHTGRLGALTARDPETGSTVQVGTGFTDSERDWIWSHRDQLEGSTVKVSMMSPTDESFRAPSFRGFHDGKGSTDAGLLMYAESVSGLDPKATQDMKYAIKTSAGWSQT